MQHFSAYPASPQAVYGGNDKLYLLSAGGASGPTITSVFSIFGAKLSGTTRTWGAIDFNNSNLLAYRRRSTTSVRHKSTCRRN